MFRSLEITWVILGAEYKNEIEQFICGVVSIVGRFDFCLVGDVAICEYIKPRASVSLDFVVLQCGFNTIVDFLNGRDKKYEIHDNRCIRILLDSGKRYKFEISVVFDESVPKAEFFRVAWGERVPVCSPEYLARKSVSIGGFKEERDFLELCYCCGFERIKLSVKGVCDSRSDQWCSMFLSLGGDDPDGYGESWSEFQERRALMFEK